jgi:predicted metal-binding membrane protein
MNPSVRGIRAGLLRPAAVAVLSLAAVSWWLSVGRMHGMDAAPGVDLGALDWFAATWLLMMAAMMLPAIAPTVAAECFPEHVRGASPGRWLVAAAFVCGYLVVWGLAGTAAYLVLEAGRDLAGGTLAWHRGGEWLSAAVLAIAAAYQLTPAKRRWLAQCRAPLISSAGTPAGGPGVGARAGLRVGAVCLACSWALMAALFALGPMSLVWMAVVATLVAAERLAPRPSPGRIASAAVLLALAVGVAAAPGSVPGLTVPGDPAGAGMMRMSTGAAHRPRPGGSYRLASRARVSAPSIKPKSRSATS